MNRIVSKLLYYKNLENLTFWEAMFLWCIIEDIENKWTFTKSSKQAWLILWISEWAINNYVFKLKNKWIIKTYTFLSWPYSTREIILNN